MATLGCPENEGGAPLIAPSAPMNLTIAPGNGELTLTWDAADSATGYNVYRSVAGAATERIAPTPTTTETTHIDRTLTNNTVYAYTVRAVNAGGESGDSNRVSATPRLPVAIWNTGRQDGDFGFPFCQTRLTSGTGAIETDLRTRGYTQARFFGSTPDYDFFNIATDPEALDVPAATPVHAFTVSETTVTSTTTFGTPAATVTIGDVANVGAGGGWQGANVVSVLGRVGIQGVGNAFWSFSGRSAYFTVSSCTGATVTSGSGAVGNEFSVDSTVGENTFSQESCNNVLVVVLCVAR